MREDPELVWEVYLSLEDEFIDYIKYVPLVADHYNVWSYQLANLLNNIGSCIDSFFKNAIYCESMDACEDIDIIRTNPKKHNMNSYRELFNAKYHLADKEIFELRSKSSHYPFLKWNEGKRPQWWADYINIKHDRFRNTQKATFNSTLEALGGLFLLFLFHRETMLVLIDNDVVKNGYQGGHPKPYLKEILTRGEPFPEERGLNQIFAKTSLFGYVYEDIHRNYDDNERKRILSPSYQGF